MRRIRFRLIAGLIAAVGLTGAGLGASPASAAEYDYPGAIDPASIIVTATDGSPETSVNDRLRVDAQWAVPDGATAGQTFGFTLPAEFAGFASTFTIPASDDPSRNVAECTVSSDAAPVVTCTLTDYVEGRSGVSGSLWFVVSADQQTSESTVTFVVDGTNTPVAVPGGGIGPGTELPQEPAKWSWTTDDGRIAWIVMVPGSSVGGADSITIHDELQPAGDGLGAHRNLDGQLSVWSTDAANVERVDVPGWTGAWDATGTSFDVEIPGPIDPSRYYVVKYYTVPTNPTDGATYANVATVNGISISDTQTWTATGGGAGSGSAAGDFSLVKEVVGDGASLAPADAAYAVTYSYGDPAVTQTVTLSAGVPVKSIALPAGTVVTLEEIAPPAIDGIEWGTPVFSGPGLVQLGEGRAELTVGSGATASIVLTNTASVIPPVPPTAVPVPKELPLTQTNTLASTGTEVPVLLLATGGAALLLGLAMTTGAVLRRRRR